MMIGKTISHYKILENTEEGLDCALKPIRSGLGIVGENELLYAKG